MKVGVEGCLQRPIAVGKALFVQPSKQLVAEALLGREAQH